MKAMPSGDSNVLRDAVKSALAGAAASTVMGGLIIIAEKAGVLGEAPPKKLTRRALEAVHLEKTARGTPLLATTAVAHVAYGAVAGVGFALLARRLPSRAARIAAGAAYGAAVWSLSYQGWIPALGWMPQPEHDRPMRPAVMFGLHLVYGALLGALFPLAPPVVESTPESRASAELDRELDDSFPASDPPSITQPGSQLPTL